MVIFNSFFDITRGYHIMIIGFTTLWTKHDPGLPGRFFAASFLQRGDQRAWEDQDGSLHVHPPKCSIISFNPYHIQIIYLNICIYKYNTLFYIIVYFFNFTILYYIILYCIILYYTILYYISIHWYRHTCCSKKLVDLFEFPGGFIHWHLTRPNSSRQHERYRAKRHGGFHKWGVPSMD